MKKFDLKDLKLGFIAEQEISESSIQSLFNKIGEVLFECVKLKAKGIKKDLKFHFDEIMFMKAINRVQTETDPGAEDSHYHIATSKGEFCLTLKMNQLFSLKFFINVYKNNIKVFKLRKKVIEIKDFELHSNLYKFCLKNSHLISIHA